MTPLVLIMGTRADEQLALEALEREGLADRSHRSLARRETWAVTPSEGGAKWRGLVVDSDDVFFCSGWDRSIEPEKRRSTVTGLFQLLRLSGANPEECGTLVL